ncbi:MAG: tetratricopeptide repeat protein [Polyangia bacterium]
MEGIMCQPPRLCSTAALLSSLILFSCGPAVKLPGVHEPLDSDEWDRCAGELAERESISLLDDLRLDSRTLLCRGVALAADGEVEQGLELLTEASVRDNEDHRPHYLMGRILVANGRYEEALAAFERSQRRFPEMEVPAERLGRRVRDREGDEEALHFLETARERDACPYGCMGLLAELLRGAGREDEAEQVYEKMVEQEPGEPAAYVGLAGLANARGDHVVESELLTEATRAEHFPDLSEARRADIHYAHAFSRYNARKLEGAARALERAMALRDERADWHVLAGWIQLARDNPAGALPEFETAIGMDSKLAAAHVGRGDALMELGSPNEAIPAYEKARELEAADAVIVLKLARAVATTGDIDAAAELVDEAAALDAEHLPPALLKKVTSLIEKEE